MNLVKHIAKQVDFSLSTFGPGPRTEGVLDHIRKELKEIEASPLDLEEWVDVILLSIDGAWRAGHSPVAIANAILAKQEKNEDRNWPDWRTAEPGKAIEHVKTARRIRMLCNDAQYLMYKVGDEATVIDECGGDRETLRAVLDKSKRTVFVQTQDTADI